MKRLKRIEDKGYRVICFASGGGYQATKNNTSIKAKSITQLHKLIFGY